MNKKIVNRLDGFGMAAAWACAAHCLALPLLLAALPFAGLGFVLVGETAERIMIGISLMIGVSSLLPAYFRQHGKLRSIGLAASGIGLIILTHLYFEEDFALKFVFLVTGAFLLTAAHLLNRRLCRSCPVC
jgi:hypothetical protein